MLGALAVAGCLLVRAHHLGDRLFGDVAEEIILIDEMVARVEVAVVLDDGIAAAGLGEGAGAGHLPDPSGQSGVEISDEYAADIIPDPIIEYVAEEPTSRRNRYVSNPRPSLA